MKAFDLYFERYPETVNYKNKDGQSAIILAARGGVNEIIDKLLSAGADVDDTDNEGNTPLHHAAGTVYNNLQCSLGKTVHH
jgi:ankyrin repeat protein